EALEDQPNLVVDVRSSYGANAALLNYRLTLRDLYLHYQREDKTGRSDLINDDRRFFDETRRRHTVPVIGVDASAPAIDYGVGVALLADGITSNPEHDVLDRDAATLLAASTVVCICGGTGHVGPRTFLTLVGAATRRPVVAGFFLRSADVRPVA